MMKHFKRNWKRYALLAAAATAAYYGADSDAAQSALNQFFAVFGQ